MSAAGAAVVGQVVLTLRLLRPRPYQLPILRHPARFKVLTAGRRWGKSKGVGLHAALAGHGPIDPATGRHVRRGAIEGGEVWWVVPEYPLTGRSRWRDIKRACRHLFPTYRAWRAAKNEVERRIDLPGGGSITLKSADDPDSLRGDGLDGVVVDEASLIDPDAWQEALRPALSDKGGWALFLFTTKGRTNWTWGLWLRGATPAEAAANDATAEEYTGQWDGWRSWQRPTSEVVTTCRHCGTAFDPDDPVPCPVTAAAGHLGYMPAAELVDARLDLGALRYAQEYDARFVVIAGGIIDWTWAKFYDADPTGFTLDGDGTPRRVLRVACRTRATVDTAASLKKAADRSAVCVYTVTPTGDMLVLDVVARRLEAPDLPGLLHRLTVAHMLTRVGVERTEAGIGLIQAAKRLGVPVVPLDPDRDKVARAELLAARMEGAAVYFPRAAPWLEDARAELTAFPNPGVHDDIVDVLAYAAHDAFESGGGPGIVAE